MSRRQQLSPIYEEWSRLFLMRGEDGALPPEAVERWRRLWREHGEGQRLARTNVHDAVLVCHIGWEIAMQEGDYSTALQRLRRWFEHPDLASAWSVDEAEMRRAM